MAAIEEHSQRKYLSDLLKKKFENNPKWVYIEEAALLIISNLPEPINHELQKKFITGLHNLKNALKALNIPKEEISFIDEEIEHQENTQQISIYEEKEDYVEQERLEKFIHLSHTQEGVIHIRAPYTYGQLRRITNYIYQKNTAIKFFVSTETSMRGKVIAEIFDHVQEVPVATVCTPKVKATSRVFLFGDTIDKKKWIVVREITQPFHVYSFINDEGKEFMLLSYDGIELGDYEIFGTQLKTSDYKKLSESSRIHTKMPFIFLNYANGTVSKYKDDEEYLKALAKIDAKKNDLFEYPFVFKIKTRSPDPDKPDRMEVVGKHPKWFKWLIWAWLCHSPQGTGNAWNLPIIIIGPPGSGKTFLLERMEDIGLEAQMIFKGEDSTIKGVVPSFHSIPPKQGYLCRCKRFALLDEFFRCLANMNDADEKNESLGRLNSLLEQKKCEFSSGKGHMKVKMSARVIFSNNPPRGVNCMEDLIKTFDRAFLTRTLIYWQKENSDHVQMIKACKESDLKEYASPMHKEDFISFIDFFRTFTCRWDASIVERIYNEPIFILTENQLDHYGARHKHHIDCIMDGIIKARAFVEGSRNFNAKTEDYEVLREIWANVIKSWNDGESIKKLPIRIRGNYLPETAQWLWRKIKDQHKELTNQELEAMADRGLTKNEFYTAFQILKNQGLIEYVGEYVHPYFLLPGFKEEEESIIVTHTRFGDEE